MQKQSVVNKTGNGPGRVQRKASSVVVVVTDDIHSHEGRFPYQEMLAVALGMPALAELLLQFGSNTRVSKSVTVNKSLSCVT